MSKPYPWPNGHRPGECPVYSHNQIEVTAPAQRVWACLIHAARWPELYSNARDIEIEGRGHDLSSGVTFSWTTFRLRVTTTVREFEPARRLAWYGKGYGSSAYHTWTLEPVGERCLLITEETQCGVIPSLGRLYLRRALARYHQEWIEGLKRVAEREDSWGGDT